MADVAFVSPKVIKVPIAILHVRYIPVVTPVDIWGGPPNMALVTSPHVKLMRAFKAGHSITDKHAYVRERIHRRKIGMARWTDAYIRYHIRKRRKLLKSIEKRGLLKQFPIELLSYPFWKTRFGWDQPWLRGPEIWTGAGRAAAAYVLGYTHVYARWYYDTKQGTADRGKFGRKLVEVEGVWEESDRLSRL